MINDDAEQRSLAACTKVVREIDIVISEIRIGQFEKESCTQDTIKSWITQIKSFLPDLADPKNFTKEYMADIETIKEKLKEYEN